MKRTKAPKPKHQAEYLFIVADVAWSFHHTTGLPFEDLYAEGCLYYSESFSTFDRCSRGKYSTFVHKIVKLRLIDYSKRENRYQHTLLNFSPPTTHTPVYEYWNWFKPDIQEIVDMVKNSNGEISGVPPKMARGVIYKSLREQGWSWPRIWDALRETRKALNEIEVGSII